MNLITSMLLHLIFVKLEAQILTKLFYLSSSSFPFLLSTLFQPFFENLVWSLGLSKCDEQKNITRTIIIITIIQWPTQITFNGTFGNNFNGPISPNRIVGVSFSFCGFVVSAGEFSFSQNENVSNMFVTEFTPFFCSRICCLPHFGWAKMKALIFHSFVKAELRNGIILEWRLRWEN